jgi:hypothetical protein
VVSAGSGEERRYKEERRGTDAEARSTAPSSPDPSGKEETGDQKHDAAAAPRATGEEEPREERTKEETPDRDAGGERCEARKGHEGSPSADVETEPRVGEGQAVSYKGEQGEEKQKTDAHPGTPSPRELAVDPEADRHESESGNPIQEQWCDTAEQLEPPGKQGGSSGVFVRICARELVFDAEQGIDGNGSPKLPRTDPQTLGLLRDLPLTHRGVSGKVLANVLRHTEKQTDSDTTITPKATMRRVVSRPFLFGEGRQDRVRV